MEHVVNFGFSFEDEKITKAICDKAEAQVIEKIKNDVEDIIYEKSYWGSKKNDPEPLRNIVKSVVIDMLEENKQTIIDMAADKLADSLRRTKAVKNAVADVIEKVS